MIQIDVTCRSCGAARTESFENGRFISAECAPCRQERSDSYWPQWSSDEVTQLREFIEKEDPAYVLGVLASALLRLDCQDLAEQVLDLRYALLHEVEEWLLAVERRRTMLHSVEGNDASDE